MTELLHAVRGWRTVRDAAARLSETSGRIVDEAEVLRLGLEGHLPLSVNFVEDVAGTLGSFVPFPEAEQSAVIARNNGVYPRTIKLDGSPYFFQPTEPEEVIAVTGIWDLPFPFLDPDGNWADSAPLELETQVETTRWSSGLPDGGGLSVCEPTGRGHGANCATPCRTTLTSWFARRRHALARLGCWKSRSYSSRGRGSQAERARRHWFGR